MTGPQPYPDPVSCHRRRATGWLFVVEGLDLALQNRVDPYGRIWAVAARGTLTGNRGVLHDERRRLTRSHQTKRWITCRLDYRGVRREVMSPGRWTELFFLDEATSLAAGHRPCFFCRYRDAVRFAELWAEVRGQTRRAKADEIDRELHAARLPGRYAAVDPATLPAGAMIEFDGAPAVIVAGGVQVWAFGGYGPLLSMPEGASLLTPQPILEVMVAGYAVELHSSALG